MRDCWNWVIYSYSVSRIYNFLSTFNKKQNAEKKLGKPDGFSLFPDLQVFTAFVIAKKLELLSCLRIGHPHLTQGYLWSTSVTQFLLIENVIWQCRINTGHESILDKHSSESSTFSLYSVLKFLQRYKTIRNRWVGRFGLASVLWTFFNNKHMWDNIDQKCLLISCYMVQM